MRKSTFRELMVLQYPLAEEMPLCSLHFWLLVVSRAHLIVTELFAGNDYYYYLLVILFFGSP
ncbi:hypothetical protein HW132_26840 [Brasilonema sp. CT11]|nr:hypothetical protein [Brasilonema sp. CT11]